MRTIDVLILCGGMGTRLRSTIGETQKVMARVGARPFLDIILEHIEHQGLRRVVLCAGYRADAVEEYYRSKEGRGGQSRPAPTLTIEFSNETEPLGTGGAIKVAEPLVKSQRFFVLNGDSFCPVDFKKFLDFHLFNKALASLVLSQAKERQDFGTVEIDNQQKVVAFKEKIKSDAAALLNAGVYCFEKDIFQYIPKQKKFSLEHDVFPNLVDKKFYGFVVNESFMDIGTPERYKNADSIFREGK